VLPDGAAVILLAGDCGLLAGAVALLLDVQSGKVPPGEVRRYEASTRLVALRDALAGAARDQQRAKNRELARVSTAKPQSMPVFLSTPTEVPSSTSATMTIAQTAAQLGISEQRARDLCRDGSIQAEQGPRRVWAVSSQSVAARKNAKRRRLRANGQYEGNAAAEPAAAA
jgi:hypothetical protein